MREPKVNSNIIQIKFICFNTKYIRTMYRMFSYCKNLNNLDLSSFDTKNVTDMSCMFSGCKNLNNLDLSSFDTKNVTNISSIFRNCPNKIYESNKSKFKRFNEEELI